MTEPGRIAPAEPFRRCRRCQTPNPVRPYLTNCLGCGVAIPAPASSSGAPARPARSTRERLGDGVLVLSWGYAVLVLALLVLVRWVGEAWWGVTLLLFLPRWLLLGPVAILAPASLIVRRPSQWGIQAAAALVVAGPLMGASIPFHQLGRGPVAGERFRILSFNRGMAHIDVPGLIDLIERERIDLISFQERSEDDASLDEYLATAWYRDRTGFLASRYPIVSERPALPEDTMPEDRYSGRLTRGLVRAPSGREFWLASVHLPTLRMGLNRFMDGDVAGLKLHIAWWRREMDRAARGLAEVGDRPFLVAGDFNMPPDDATMAGFRAVCKFGFEEAGWGYGYTRPSRTPWFRIDHIMASPDWAFTRCWVGPDLGSDHLPLLAEVVLPAPAAGPRAQSH